MDQNSSEGGREIQLEGDSVRLGGNQRWLGGRSRTRREAAPNKTVEGSMPYKRTIDLMENEMRTRVHYPKVPMTTKEKEKENEDEDEKRHYSTITLTGV